jgi:hypothetical protein
MSWKFKIEHTWLDHSEGTKFYHPFRITEAAGGRAVTALHFGPYRGDSTPFRRPVRGGQVQFKPDRETYDRQIRSKVTLSGGYVKRHVEMTADFSDEAIFRAELLKQFGATNSGEILVKLGMSSIVSDEAKWEPDENYLESSPVNPSGAGDDTGIERFKDRPAAWGLW